MFGKRSHEERKRSEAKLFRACVHTHARSATRARHAQHISPDDAHAVHHTGSRGWKSFDRGVTSRESGRMSWTH